MAIPVEELEDFYEPAFRALLFRVRHQHLQSGVRRLLRLAVHAATGSQPAAAFRQVYERTRARVIRRLLQRRQSAGSTTATRSPRSDARRAHHARELFDASILSDPLRAAAQGVVADFYCDSGLGGLARWLRAAGYDAHFFPHIDDADLLRRTIASCSILLTTDRPLTQRAIVRWGAVPALLVPFSAGKHGQFDFVAARLNLPLKSPRCMSCGGWLAAVAKQQVRDRIPPKTFPWCDDYFLCQRCGKLFWRGTHWGRIERQLTMSMAKISAATGES